MTSAINSFAVRGSMLLAMVLASMASAASTTVPASRVPASASAPASEPADEGSEPSITRFTLANGLRVAVLRHPRLETLGVYTYLPGGLLADDPQHTMWTRLVERLVTQTGGFSTGAVEPGFTRLETRVWPDKLDSALDEQRRLLLTMPFQNSLVEVYREDVIAEAIDREQFEQKDPLNARLDSFRAAEAVFGQAWRHGRSEVNLDQEVGEARTAEVQAYHERYWRCKDALLCVVGNVDPREVEKAVRKRFSWPMDPASHAPRSASPAKDFHVAWDLTNRYVCMAWPTPERSPREQAALAVARCLLEMSWGREMTWYMGLLESRLNLRTPESLMVWIGVSLRADITPDLARRAIRERLNWLPQVEEKELSQARRIAAAVLTMSTESQYIRDARLRGGEITPWMRKLGAEMEDLDSIVREEEQRLREWCDLEWYYGTSLPQIRLETERIRANDLERVVEKFLSPRNAITLTIEPRAAK